MYRKMNHRVARIVGLLVVSLFALTAIAADSSDAPTKVLRTFKSSEDLAGFREVFVEESRYPHSDQAGSDGEKGVILSRNRKLQGEQLVLTEPTVDLRHQKVAVQVDFQAKKGGPGVSRVFLGLGENQKANLQHGVGKIGVRVFKGDSPKYSDRPFVFQLVNGIATRNIEQQFQLQTDQWYRIRFETELTENKKAFEFTASLQELNDQGNVGDGLRRTLSGTTKKLAEYDLSEMHLALLGQNNKGGAKAFDNLLLEKTTNGEQPTEEIAEVDFIPAPLPKSDFVPEKSIFGVCGHAMHTKHFYPDKDFSLMWEPERTVPFMVQADLAWLREPLYQAWFDDIDNPRAVANRKRIERYLDLYQRYDINVLLVAMAVSDENTKHVQFRDDYFKWLGMLAKEYDCVKVIEMHNEPNLDFFWRGTAEEYTRIYRDGAKLIREQAPDVQIAVGSISSLWWKSGIEWFDAAIDAGVLEYADAVSVHPYHKKNPPEVDPYYDKETNGENTQQAIFDWWKRIETEAPKDRDLKLYFTEFGYSSGDEGMAAIGSEERQADYLSRTMLTYFDTRLQGVPIEGVFWYDLKNDGTSRHGESRFGLIDYHLTRTKPAYESYRRIARFFADPTEYESVGLSVDSSNLPDAFKSYSWRQKDGNLIVPFWRMAHQQVKDKEFNTLLTIELPKNFTPERVVLHRLQEQQVREIGFAVDGDQLMVPVIVEDRAAWLEVE